MPAVILSRFAIVIVEGVSSYGKKIKYYQTITVASTNTHDTDGDGVLNDRDLCPYIYKWYDEETGQNVCDMPLATDEDGTDEVPDVPRFPISSSKCERRLSGQFPGSDTAFGKIGKNKRWNAEPISQWAVMADWNNSNLCSSDSCNYNSVAENKICKKNH